MLCLFQVYSKVIQLHIHMYLVHFRFFYQLLLFNGSIISDSFDPMDCSTPDFLVLRYFLEFPQTHAHWVHDTIQPSHPLSPPFPPVLNLSQHQGLFQWVSSSHEVAKVLELQLQHQSLLMFFPIKLLHNVEHSSLCHRVIPFWLSILNIVVGTWYEITPKWHECT